MKFDAEYACTSFFGKCRPHGNPSKTLIHMWNIRNLWNLMNCKIVLRGLSFKTIRSFIGGCYLVYKNNLRNVSIFLPEWRFFIKFPNTTLNAAAAVDFSFRCNIYHIKQYACCQRLQSTSLDWLFNVFENVHNTLMINTWLSSIFVIYLIKGIEKNLWKEIFVQLRCCWPVFTN